VRHESAVSDRLIHRHYTTPDIRCWGDVVERQPCKHSRPCRSSASRVILAWSPRPDVPRLPAARRRAAIGRAWSSSIRDQSPDVVFTGNPWCAGGHRINRGIGPETWWSGKPQAVPGCGSFISCARKERADRRRSQIRNAGWVGSMARGRRVEPCW